VQSIFFDKNYSDLLLLPPELLIVQENDPAVALEAININEVHIYSVVGSTSSGPIRDKANEALAALDWLKSEYRSAMMIAVQSQAPDDGQSEDGEDNPDTETNQERGEVGKATDFFRQNSQRFQENWLMKQDRPWNRFIKALETLFSKNK
jgi:hypothetical protein